MTEPLELVKDHAAYTRAGDPNRHTHVAVSTKVQGADGKWRSLDARALYRIAVAASECYSTAFETRLTALLGVTFTARPDTAGGREPVREITGIPPSMTAYFSRRRAAIETRYTGLLREYRDRHGHDPDAATTHKLAQQATLDTPRPSGRPAPSPISAPPGGRTSPAGSAPPRPPGSWRPSRHRHRSPRPRRSPSPTWTS